MLKAFYNKNLTSGLPGAVKFNLQSPQVSHFYPTFMCSSAGKDDEIPLNLESRDLLSVQSSTINQLSYLVLIANSSLTLNFPQLEN
jgi:hypothetical protein